MALPREIGMLAGAAALVARVSDLVAVDGRGHCSVPSAADLARILDARFRGGHLHRLAPRRSPAVGHRASSVVVAAVVAIAIGRGLFVWRAEHAGNPVVRIGFPQDNWTDAMKWISNTPPDAHILASPGHAWMYGTSVRVSGERDVYLEEVKGSCPRSLFTRRRRPSASADSRLAELRRADTRAAALAGHALRSRLPRRRARRRPSSRVSQRSVPRVRHFDDERISFRSPAGRGDTG